MHGHIGGEHDDEESFCEQECRQDPDLPVQADLFLCSCLFPVNGLIREQKQHQGKCDKSQNADVEDIMEVAPADEARQSGHQHQTGTDRRSLDSHDLDPFLAVKEICYKSSDQRYHDPKGDPVEGSCREQQSETVRQQRHQSGDPGHSCCKQKDLFLTDIERDPSGQESENDGDQHRHRHQHLYHADTDVRIMVPDTGEHRREHVLQSVHQGNGKYGYDDTSFDPLRPLYFIH